MQRRSAGHESLVPDPGAIRRVRVYVLFGTQWYATTNGLCIRDFVLCSWVRPIGQIEGSVGPTRSA
jgi:hypothetical protein